MKADPDENRRRCGIYDDFNVKKNWTEPKPERQSSVTSFIYKKQQWRSVVIVLKKNELGIH